MIVDRYEMVMNARYRIEEWFHSLEQSGERMKREDVCFIMVQARHLIERAHAQEKYRLATFYADWTVHSAIDRSPVCFEILTDITRVLSVSFNETKLDITSEISRVIGFPRLRSELMNLFLDNGLPTILFEYIENWRSFVMFLLWFLAGQPIRFPDSPSGRVNKIREEMLALQRPHNIAVESLAVAIHQDVFHWVLEVSGDKEITMMGQVEIAEAADAFSTSQQTGGRPAESI